MLKRSKDESLGERETYRQSRRHRLCSCVLFLGRRHLGLGVSWFLSPVGDSLKWTWYGDITGWSIGADSHNCWWRRSSLPRLGSCCVHRSCGASILPASSRRRSIRRMLAVAFLSSSRKRRHLLQIIIILFILFSLGVFDYGMRLD